MEKTRGETVMLEMSKDTGLPPWSFCDMMDDQFPDDSVPYITEFATDSDAAERDLSADYISLIGSTTANSRRPYSQSDWTSTTRPGYPRSPESSMVSDQNTGPPEMSYGASAPGNNPQMSYGVYTSGNNPAGQRASSGQFANGFAQPLGLGMDSLIGHNPQNQLQSLSQPPEMDLRQRSGRCHQTSAGFGGNQGEARRRYPRSFPGDEGMDDRQSFH